MTDFYARKPDSWSWELESTLLFMMTSFLKSRTEAGLPSNERFYDEDVNVYLAGLLSSYVNPRFMEDAGRYISPFDIDVAEMARIADERSRFTIYKVNADHLIVSAGIFDPEIPAEDSPLPPSAETVTRGQTYYQLAASYGRALARRDTGAVDVLGKLSRGFGAYVCVLNHLRCEYFNLIERLGSGTMDGLRAGIEQEARRAEQQGQIDALLDLYSLWLRTGDDDLRGRMQELADAIRTDDPDFEFDLPGNS